MKNWVGIEGGIESFVWCSTECESVMYVLCECPAYSSCRLEFLEKPQEILGDRYI